MQQRAIILDCDFGEGEVEAPILASHGISLEVLRDRHISAEQATHLDCIAVLTQYSEIDQAFLDRNPGVRVAVRYGVGTDTIDEDAAKNAGLRYAGVPDYCTAEVADHAMALLLSGVRSIDYAATAVRRGEWPPVRELPVARKLDGRTLGLLGAGRIAAAVATRAHGFGLEVAAHDPYLDNEQIRARGMRPVDLEELARADLISLHAPLTSATHHIIDNDLLERMHDVLLINVSRSGLIDEPALLRALDHGNVAWAGLDVVDSDSGNKTLIEHPRITITPHIAYYSDSSLHELRVQAAQVLVRLVAEVSRTTRSGNNS